MWPSLLCHSSAESADFDFFLVEVVVVGENVNAFEVVDEVVDEDAFPERVPETPECPEIGCPETGAGDPEIPGIAWIDFAFASIATIGANTGGLIGTTKGFEVKAV